jgi:hypothetical protein
VKIRKTYGVGAGADAEPLLVLSSVRDMLPKRLSMSGKKSSLGKMSSSWASVMNKPSVIAQSAPQKPYRLSPVQDHKRRGSRGLLSWLVVHTARRDGEDDRGSTMLRNEEAAEAVCCVSTERSDLSYIAIEEGKQAAPGGETNSQKMNRIDLYSFPTQANISAST